LFPTTVPKIAVLTIAIIMDSFPTETSWKLLNGESLIIDECLPGFYSRDFAAELTTVIAGGGAAYTFLLDFLGVSGCSSSNSPSRICPGKFVISKGT
jgi:hypothetical protein